MKCKNMQEKEKINLKLQNKKKVQKLKEKGITLIALVVTIIILLILAGVTLNMALSGDGLFSKARNAADKYKKAQKDEEELISDIGKEMNSEYVGAFVTGYTPKNNSCTITGEQSGTGSDQIIETSKEELKWKIWDYDGTTLRIILDRPTTQTLTLKGANGYNYGVWAVNEICRKCFGQYEEDGLTMKKGISVANLRRSDIQKICTYDYTKYKHLDQDGSWTDKEEGTVQFGNVRKYDNNKYPAIWNLLDRNWTYRNEGGKESGDDKECLIWEQELVDGKVPNGYEQGDDKTAFVNSYYAHDFKNEKNKFINEEYYNMIFSENEKKDKDKGLYWLAGRYASLQKTYCLFSLQNVDNNGTNCWIGGYRLYNSDRNRKWERFVS